MLLNEISGVQKAGFVPYVMEKEPLFLFMVSSNPTFGGSLPMISKGHVETGEDIEEAAYREAEEELGLIRSNVVSAFKGWSGQLSGFDAHYTLTIYCGMVSSQSDFNEPHFETKETVWMTLDQFKKRGRKSHVPIVQNLYDQIMGKEKGA